MREQGRRGRAQRQRLRDVAEREHASGPVAVGEHRRERRRDPRRNQLREGDEPGGCRSALLVGIDEHRDPDAPLGRVEACEGELDPPQLGIAEHAPDHRANPAEMAHACRGRRSATAALISRSMLG